MRGDRVGKGKKTPERGLPKGTVHMPAQLEHLKTKITLQAVERIQVLLIAKRFCRMYWSQFPQLSIPLSIRSVHHPAINRTVSSIPKSLTQMTATVKVIRESPDKVIPQCLCGLLRRVTGFFVFSHVCVRGDVLFCSRRSVQDSLLFFLSPQCVTV